MTQRKICILGSLNVGKTSLVTRFTDGVFSDERQSTIGVKVATKTLTVQDEPMELVIWDVYGENKYQKVQTSYLKNTSGYLLVVDGTNAQTLKTAVELRDRVREHSGDLPYVLVINKFDLNDQWQLLPTDWEALASDARAVVRTSAKNGDGVDRAFYMMAASLAHREAVGDA